ncbi:MAG: PilZ domain-containing protein [Pyrinomonadaceae bacterium]
MLKLVNSFVDNVYQYFGNNSYARHYDVRLPMSVSLLYFKTAKACVPCSPSVRGYLRDVSKTGLSMIVPSLQFGGYFLLEGNYPLGVTIETPAGVINIQAAPVRYDKLDEGPGERGYLIGARITHITDSDRKHLASYIRQVREGRSGSFDFARGANSI